MRILLAALSLSIAAPVTAQDAGPVLASPTAFAAMARDGARYPLFADEVARTRVRVNAAIRAGIDVPLPKDPAGGITHEQHRRNYQTLYGAGLLYRITGERRYADYVRALLLAYARLYPTLGPHPARVNENAGRLFWQSLNDSVWLVYAVQGYDAIRDTLTPSDRRLIDEQVFRSMATFLSSGSPDVFNRIHNHATWACAGVGMTGYVLRDPTLVAAALDGLDGSGKAGFFAQVDQLFSPDGYYAEGPYYQRYALLPFVLFAQAIADNDPARRIFERRDGVLLKAITTTIQLTYDDRFFPLNDAIREKSLDTDELWQAIAIGYAQSRNGGLLAIARDQGHTTLTVGGLAVARDLAAGKAKPFPFASALFRDGPTGDRGGVAVMRSDAGNKAAVVVAKNTAMGMGHGHFDKLNWLFYDNGQAVVTDYGAARFLNVESKDGGRYLPENESWAKQTVAHNTLVVDEASHFGAKWRDGEKAWPRQLFYAGDGPTRVSTAEMAGAYPGVRFRRTLVQFATPGRATPMVLDLLRVDGDRPATYDLPLHYAGHITRVGFALRSNPAVRPVLGTANGYQHVWVDATGIPGAGDATLTWMLGNRFYTWRMLPPAGAEIILGESGANDPRFDLRREPMVIQRVRGATDATFVGLLEPHGSYDPVSEAVASSDSAVAALAHARATDADVVTVTLAGGRKVVLAIADSADPGAAHRTTTDGRTFAWTGHWARFDYEVKQ